jgi:hypothetical protein
MSARFLTQMVSIATMVLFTVFLACDVQARGGGGGGARGGGGGGFSRSGPAASGSFSSRGSYGGTTSRQAGSVQRSGQRAQTQQTRTETRGETRTSGQGERTQRQGQRQEGATNRTAERQEGATQRTQTRAAAASNVAGDWDNNYHGCCWGGNNNWGYAAAGVAVGAAVGYAAGAATTPTPVTVLPCAPTVVTVNGTSYYQCGATWYSRSYVSGTLSYVTVAPPSGY